MEQLYKSLTKLPDSEQEVVIFKPNGKKAIKTITVTDRYLLTLNNGNSIALTKQGLKDLGINFAEISKKDETVVKIDTKINEPEENVE